MKDNEKMIPFEETTRGTAFLNAAKEGKIYLEKHPRADLTGEELNYIRELSRKSANDLFDAIALAYRAGLTRGRRAEKKETRQ